MQNLKFSRLAQSDLYEVVDYIALDNPLAAYKVHDAIMETCKLLLDRPQSAAQAPSATKGLRRAVVKGYPTYPCFLSRDRRWY